VKTSVKLLFAACLVGGSSSALSTPPGQHCGKLLSTDEVSSPLTIAEIEKEEMATLLAKLKMRPDYSRVPFGFINAEWTVFKAMLRPGDKIVRYSTDSQSWQHRAGESGYALIRSGCIVETFKTLWN
jgi:hypothetical protein